MITKEQQETLVDIFTNSDRSDKMSIEFDTFSRTVTIRYEDIDGEWFNELRKYASLTTTRLKTPAPAPE
jgi:hypothetical protein